MNSKLRLFKLKYHVLEGQCGNHLGQILLTMVNGYISIEFETYKWPVENLNVDGCSEIGKLDSKLRLFKLKYHVFEDQYGYHIGEKLLIIDNWYIVIEFEA